MEGDDEGAPDELFADGSLASSVGRELHRT